MSIDLRDVGVLDHRTMLACDFALINAMQVEPEARADLDGHPIVPTRFASQAHLFPLLIELRALPDSVRIDLLDRMAQWHRSRGTPYFSALLACSDDAATLLHHLVHRSDVRLPDGSGDILRLHDPRVFQHLPWILSQGQMAALLGNIRDWLYPEADGTWRGVVNDHAHAGARLDRFHIDPGQWSQLLRLADTNAVLATLQRKAPQSADDGKLAARIDARLAEAERDLPNASVDDRRLYAEHAVRFGAALHRHPEFVARMLSVRAGKQSYFAAFAGLDDETLEAWAAAVQPAKECA